MKTQANNQAAGSDRLRRVLRGNGIFCGVSGVILILGARPISSFLGMEVTPILVATGVLLLFYAALLFWTAACEPVDRRLVLTAALLDTAWVIGSAALLLTGWLPLTTQGKWTIALVAEVVAIFAVLQFYSVRR